MTQSHSLIILFLSISCLLIEKQLVESTPDDENNISSYLNYIQKQIFVSVKQLDTKNSKKFGMKYVTDNTDQITGLSSETNAVDGHAPADRWGIKTYDDLYSFSSEEQTDKFLLKSILYKVDKQIQKRRRFKYEMLAKQASLFGSQFEGCSKDPYPTSQRKTQPIKKYEINLDARPEDRWREVVQQNSDQMKKLANFFEETLGSWVMRIIDTAMTHLHHSLPAEYHQELSGISAASGLSVARVTLYNVFYELFTLCTSIVMEAEDGSMYHGRNLDFGLFLGWDAKNHTWFITELLRPLIIKVNFLKNNKPLYSAVTYAGYTGILTGIKKNAFSLTINERFSLNGGYVGLAEWILGVRDASWLGLLTRQVMEEATSYDQAQQLLTHTPLVAPVYFILAGNSSQGSIVTRERRGADIWPLGSRHKQQNGSWFLVETNFDHWKDTPIYDQRRKYAVQCMDELGREKPLDTLYKVLSTRPILNKETTLTAVMGVREGLLEVWERDCQDPCWPF